MKKRVELSKYGLCVDPSGLLKSPDIYNEDGSLYQEGKIDEQAVIWALTLARIDNVFTIEFNNLNKPGGIRNE